MYGWCYVIAVGCCLLHTTQARTLDYLLAHGLERRSSPVAARDALSALETIRDVLQRREAEYGTIKDIFYHRRHPDHDDDADDDDIDIDSEQIAMEEVDENGVRGRTDSDGPLSIPSSSSSSSSSSSLSSSSSSLLLSSPLSSSTYDDADSSLLRKLIRNRSRQATASAQKRGAPPCYWNVVSCYGKK